MSPAHLLALVDALADGAPHSGQQLAAQFNISRAALAKWVDKLRQLGLTVQAQAGEGYWLQRPFERLDPSRLAQGLNAALTVEAFTESTNSQLLLSPAQHDPQFLFTEWQSAGRGRRGKSWLGGLGQGLMFSLAYSFPAWPPRLTTLPLAVAVSLARVLQALGVNPAIKWPNDLLLGSAKLAGILIEPRGETGGACRVVIGVGLNLELPQPAPEQAVAALYPALRASGSPLPSRNAVAAQLAQALLADVQQFAQHGFAPFRPEWRLRDALQGKQIVVTGPPNTSGMAMGIDDDGGLLLSTHNGTEVVHSGDVSVRAA